MYSMDEIAVRSRLTTVDPKAKLILGFTVLLMTPLANALLSSLLTLMAVSLLTLWSSRQTMRNYFRLMCLPMGFITLAIVPILIQGQPSESDLLMAWAWGHYKIGITHGSFTESMKLMLRALASVSGMYFITLSTPMHDVLATLRKWHMPELIVDLMALMYRYIFVFGSELLTMKNAQASRLGYGSFRSSVRSAGQLAAGLYQRTYIKCDRVYDALESRGYRGEFYQMEKSFHSGNVLIKASAALTVVIWALAWLERGLLGCR